MILLTGCASFDGSRTAPDGSKLALKVHRFLWQSQDMKFVATDTNGFRITIEAKSSNPNVEIIEAVRSKDR